MGLQVEEIEPPVWRSCEAEQKNMKERGKKRAENEKGGRISYRENGGKHGAEEKKRRKKAEKQGLPSRELAC